MGLLRVRGFGCTLFALGLMLISGCATTMPAGIGPDGKPAKIVYGDNQKVIFDEASLQCPAGYNIISKNSGDFFMRASMVIQCSSNANPSLQPAPSADCPKGYVCSPIKPVVTCPQGYVCQRKE